MLGHNTHPCSKSIVSPEVSVPQAGLIPAGSEFVGRSKHGRSDIPDLAVLNLKPLGYRHAIRIAGQRSGANASVLHLDGQHAGMIEDVDAERNAPFFVHNRHASRPDAPYISEASRIQPITAGRTGWPSRCARRARCSSRHGLLRSLGLIGGSQHPVFDAVAFRVPGHHIAIDFLDPVEIAPPGKSAVEIWYATRYDYWEKIAADRPAYEEEKKRIADVSIAKLDRRWPGFASAVEVVDVPTPATYFRYTGNWQGSPDGWYVTPENMGKRTVLRTLPGLSDLYMVGQWTAPFTGTIMAALSGRQLIQILCKRDKTPFVTSL